MATRVELESRRAQVLADKNMYESIVAKTAAVETESVVRARDRFSRAATALSAALVKIDEEIAAFDGEAEARNTALDEVCTISDAAGLTQEECDLLCMHVCGEKKAHEKAVE